uniref:isochorismatase family protein n=1 Tax=Ndongobacter massiliensis TaxID=1871025 RepID=UPI000B06A40F|nr:isochorismatase family protein [Ndongobacter massiliensis]
MTFNEMESKIERYRLRRTDAVLFIIDIQEKLLPIMQNQMETVKNTDVLLQAAQAYNIPALYSEQYPKGLGATVKPLRTHLSEQDAWGLSKTSYDAVLPELRSYLQKLNRPQIVVTGMETHICVYQTVRSLRALGYEVFLPADAITSRDPGNKKTALALLRDMGCIVTNTECLLFDLIGDAKDPHFKALQSLIK